MQWLLDFVSSSSLCAVRCLHQAVACAVIYGMLACTQHTLPLQYCREALDGHGVFGSCLQETDYINSTCLCCAERKSFNIPSTQ